jgi:hypothetical protein
VARFAPAALIVLLAACNNSYAERSPNVAVSGQAARIDEASLLRRHPFAPVVAQIDADIATLQASLHGGLSNAGTALAGSRAVLRAQLSNAGARARAIDITPPSQTHEQPPEPNDFAVNRGIAAFRAALDARMQRAVAMQEARMREKEATADYQFGRAHAGERLQLELRSKSPYLDDRTRQAILARLSAIDAEERRVLSAQRARDAVDLARSRSTLIADGQRQAASMERDLQARAAAAGRLPQPNNSIVKRAESIPTRANSAQTAAAFDRAKDDLSARFAQLRDWNARDVASAQEELSALRAERDRLVSEMRLQIESQAARIARERGLGRVYNGNSPPGAADLTREVGAAIGSIRG